MRRATRQEILARTRMARSSAGANELSNGRGERPLGFTIVIPGLALAQESWGGSNRKASWVETFVDLVPIERHRHGSSLAQTWRKRGDRRRHTIVAQIVEKDAARSLLLGHVEQVTVRAIVCHLAAHALSEAFGLLPAHAVIVSDLQGSDHVDTLASRSFAEGDQSEFLQTLPQLLRGCDHHMKCDVGCRIEIEDEASRDRWVKGLAVPGVIFNRGQLCHGHQSLDAVDLDIGLPVAGYRRQRDELGDTLHGVALKEPLPVDAIWRADDRARPPFEVAEHPGADLLQVAGQF